MSIIKHPFICSPKEYKKIKVGDNFLTSDGWYSISRIDEPYGIYFCRDTDFKPFSDRMKKLAKDFLIYMKQICSFTREKKEKTENEKLGINLWTIEQEREFRSQEWRNCVKDNS